MNLSSNTEIIYIVKLITAVLAIKMSLVSALRSVVPITAFCADIKLSFFIESRDPRGSQ